MHKKTSKRSVFNPLTQKVKAPQHLVRLKDYQDEKDNKNNFIPLPSLQRKKSSKDIDNSSSSWDEDSVSTTISWSEEMEEITTRNTLKQWNIIEGILYDEQNEIVNESVLRECSQWKAQVSHLRVKGTCMALVDTDSPQSIKMSVKSAGKSFFETNGSSLNRSLPVQSVTNSTKHKSHKKAFEEILNFLVDYVSSQIFSETTIEADTLSETLSDVLKLSPAIVHSVKSSTGDSRVSRSKHNVLPDNNLEYIRRKSYAGDSFDKMQHGDFSIHQRVLRGNGEHPVSAMKKNDSNTKEISDSPVLCRNKLGTIFNERIVVSPVPFALSTRESFSTLKTTPVRYSEQASAFSSKGSNRSAITKLKTSRRSTITPISNIQSAWQPPICPTIWPKNVKLAPIDTSRLPCVKNRVVDASAVVIQPNKKPLSPISRPTVSATVHATRDTSNEPLEMQGKQITRQSAKLNFAASIGDCSSRNSQGKKKKSRARRLRQ